MSKSYAEGSRKSDPAPSEYRVSFTAFPRKTRKMSTDAERQARVAEAVAKWHAAAEAARYAHYAEPNSMDDEFEKEDDDAHEEQMNARLPFDGTDYTIDPAAAEPTKVYCISPHKTADGKMFHPWHNYEERVHVVKRTGEFVSQLNAISFLFINVTSYLSDGSIVAEDKATKLTAAYERFSLAPAS